jgi:O-antigen/teichoic acid export membrane protein
MHPERYPLPSQFIESQRVAPGADGECPPTPPAGQDSSGVAAGGRTVRGFARLIGGLGAARVMDFGFYLILARALGVERFGVYTFSVSFVMLAHVLTDMGLSIVLARDVAKSPARIRALLSEAVRLKAALALVTMIAVGAAAGIAGLPRDVLAAVALLTIAMVSNSLAQTFEAILKSAGRAGSAGLSAFAQSTAGLLTGAALIVLGAGVFAGVLAYLVAAVVHVSVAAARSRDLWRGQGAAEAPRQRGRMLREALPLALSGVFIAIYFRIDAVMLQALQGERAVGLYGGVYRLFEALAILSAAARSVLFPLMARAADGPADALRLLCRRSLRLQLMGTIGIAVFLSMQAEPIVLALLGDGFAPAAPALALLACAVPFAFMADLLLAFLIAGPPVAGNVGRRRNGFPERGAQPRAHSAILDRGRGGRDGRERSVVVRTPVRIPQPEGPGHRILLAGLATDRRGCRAGHRARRLRVRSNGRLAASLPRDRAGGNRVPARDERVRRLRPSRLRTRAKTVAVHVESPTRGGDSLKGTGRRMGVLVRDLWVNGVAAWPVCPRSEGASLPRMRRRILPSFISFKPNGGAAQPMSIWPDITCVNVEAGPPVAVGLALTPSSLTKARTRLFVLDPLVE